MAKVEFKEVAAGEVFVATCQQISIETIAMCPGPRKLLFRGYKYVTTDAAEIKWLVDEINSQDCPWLTGGEYMKESALDPLTAVREKAVADYLKSVQAAAAGSSTSSTAPNAVMAASGDFAGASVKAALEAQEKSLAIKK